MKKSLVFDRIHGALVGVAVGDALGGPLEFMTAETINEKHGRVTEMIGGGWLNLKPGEITDDTQMTLAVARGIIEDPNAPVTAIGRNFIKWYNSKPKDVGGTCAAAIRRAIRLKVSTANGWREVGESVAMASDGRNAGNGALMRTIYPALYYADRRMRRNMTEYIGMMTHNNRISTAICREYVEVVHAAIFGEHPVHAFSPEMFEPGTKPTGFVWNSWGNAMESILKTDTFEDAVIEAVNRGGDADTIGAITGGLAGAYYGYSNIPQRWVQHLDPKLREELEQLAELAHKAHKEYMAKYSVINSAGIMEG